MDESPRILRQALKNPLVTLGLCLIAGFAVYNNMGIETSDPSGMRQSEGEQLSPSSALPPAIHEPTYEYARVQWIDHPDRDPFAPISAAAPPPVEPLPTGAPLSVEEHPQVQDVLVLKAIAVDGRQRSAVINRTVVYEGEMINGYRIESIQPTGVRLEKDHLTRRLTFTEKTALAVASN